MITQLFGKIRTRRNPCANLRKVFDFKYFLLVFQRKKLRIVCRFKKMQYLCTNKSRPLPIRTAYPAGHFLYIDMRYTKQAMTLAQQIQTLQGRGLMIADTRTIKVQHISLLLTILGLRIRNLTTSLFLPNLLSA